jgi:hypothetical protein
MHIGYITLRGADLDEVSAQFIKLMKRFAGVK